MQDEIAQTVVTELLGKIPATGADNPAFIGAVDPAAHEKYLQGRAMWIKRDREALELFKASTTLDPDHWLAWAYLAIVSAISDDRQTRDLTNEALANAV
ncbi:MAG: hypothetical protein AB8B96_14625 [Lysobacterales bacterium]